MRWARLLLVTGSALLVDLAFPPFNLVPLLFVALIPMLWVVSRSTGKESWKRGYLFGLVIGLGQLHFIFQLTNKWTGSWALALVPWLLASVLMPIYFGLAWWLVRVCMDRGLSWCAPFAWAAVEVFRSYIPVFAFPWALLATPLWQWPALIQLGHLGTIFLVSAWVFAVNGALGLVLSRFGPKLKIEGGRVAVWSVGSCAGLAVSLALYAIPVSTQPNRLTVGQTGFDMAFADPNLADQKAGAAVGELERDAVEAHSRLLVLPEGLARSRPDGTYFDFPLDARIGTLFGAQRQGTHRDVYQSAIGFDGAWHSADKTRLVIFGEFVPAKDYIPFLSAFGLPGGDLSAGESGTQSMTLNSETIGPIICFEGLFPDIAYRQSLNGAKFLAIMSLDDWFMTSSAPEQLEAAAIWRATETGLPLVRAASLGHSLACDGKGRILAAAPLGVRTALNVDLPIPTQTPCVRQLPIFPLGCLAFGATLILIVLIGRFRTSRSRHGTSSSPQPGKELPTFN